MLDYFEVRRACFFLVTALVSFTACGGSGVKTDYILAEKLWDQKSYAPSARQFERVFQKDQNGKLGQQALYRAATTHLLFLKDYSRALKLFKRYLEVSPKGPAARDAQLQIGEIYFSGTSQYEAAIQHYKEWIRQHPSDPEVTRVLMRIGRSYYFLGQFHQALEAFQAILQRSPAAELLSESRYQMGMSYLALAVAGKSPGSEGSDAEAFNPQEFYAQARNQFEIVERDYPDSAAAPQAGLALVTYYEEQGLWEEALAKINTLATRHPAPEILQIRGQRIRERLGRKSLSGRR